jgi:hypothetical protein
MMISLYNGVAIALATYIVLIKLGISSKLSNSFNVIGLNVTVEALIDATFTAILFVLFSGSYGGSMSAIMGGLLLSLMLFTTRFIGAVATILIILSITAIGAYYNVY